MTESSTLYELFDPKNLRYWETKVDAGIFPSVAEIVDLLEANAQSPLPPWFRDIVIQSLRGKLPRKEDDRPSQLTPRCTLPWP